MLDTKDKILMAACDIYLDQGTKGMSMRKVASKAGITPTAIYRHFDSKETLHQQVLIDGFRAFGSYLYPALKGETPLERLHLAAEAFFRFATEQARYYELLFLTMEATDEINVDKILKREARSSYEFMIERVRECIDSGAFSDDDPEEIAMLLLSVCNGFFGLYVSKKFEGDSADMKKKYDRAYQRILKGLLA
ncbi:MAG: TetR/AcrR family transcriptional regulator [Hahellaceae bacterium]|jgi:AcrR family transcriptional regulator|nr:TetR/AcrR family transcriptional regulator [Hahellaceae bacterium]MCP5211436.1 TetR/AcrR family transcriptional regulator [Hahellaceae bacterium]